MKHVFYETFIEKSNHVLSKLEKLNDTEFDIQEMFFSFTMDSIEKFFMGSEVNTIEGGMSHYGKAFDNAHYFMMKFAYNSVYLDLVVRLLTPYPFGPWTSEGSSFPSPMGRFLSMFNSSRKNFHKSVGQLDKHIYDYIKEKKLDSKISEKKDIIANFLNSGAELSDKQIHDIVLNLTIAGRDTTACTLSWLVYELTQNLDVQEKLIQEIDEKLQGELPSFEDLEAENMPYLHGVLYETLRLHPAVPVNEKVLTRETQYHDGTVIPEGTFMLYCPYAIGRNEKTFKNPEQFEPNRWIPFVQPDPYEFPVFQAGPRFCLGKDMAQFEIKLLISIMLQHYRFKMNKSEAAKISYSLMLTLSIVNDEKKSSHKLLVIPIKRKTI